MKKLRLSKEDLSQLLAEAESEHEEILRNIENLNYLNSHDELAEDPKYIEAVEYIRNKLKQI